MGKKTKETRRKTKEKRTISQKRIESTIQNRIEIKGHQRHKHEKLRDTRENMKKRAHNKLT